MFRGGCLYVFRGAALRELLQEFRENFLAVGEGLLHLAADECGVGDCAHGAEADFVFDLVADERSGNAVAGFGAEFVAVMPGFEWTLVLYVGEVMVPFEFCDAGDPRGAQGQKREDAKRSDDGRAHAGGLVGGHAGRRRGRGYSVQRDELRLAGGVHDARQVFRVREERENALDREGNPVFELEMVGH
jgi:hypothetical protein